MSKLEIKIKKAASAYYAGTPIMSDNAFDLLTDQLPKGHKLRTTPGWGASELATAAEGKVKIKHKHLIEGLPKKMYEGEESTVYEITPKLDGAACVAYYDSRGVLENAVTRGDGYYGIRVDAEMESLPENFIPHAQVRGEVVILVDDWLELLDRDDCRQYKHPRNAVCGILNSVNRDLDQYLTFIAYTWINTELGTQTESNFILEEEGFITLRPVYEHNESLYDNNSCFEGEEVGHPWKEVIPNGYAVVDGSVWRHVESGIASAFKYKNLEVPVTVTRVEWIESDRGRLHPTVHFTPVELDGATIAKASGKSGAFIMDNEIGPGAKIIIRRANNVIPDIVSVVEGADLVMPDVNYYWEGANMRASEGRSNHDGFVDTCRQMILSKCHKGIAEAGINQYVIISDSIEDCIMDDQEKVGKTYRAIEQGLAVAKMADWSNYELLLFCKIDGIGRRAATSYLRDDSTDRIKRLIEESSLYRGLLRIYAPPRKFPRGFIHEDEDNGMVKVCITGSLNGYTKKEFAEKYEFQLVTTVKAADIVVASDTNSAKAKQATKLGKSILTQEQYESL